MAAAGPESWWAWSHFRALTHVDVFYLVMFVLAALAFAVNSWCTGQLTNIPQSTKTYAFPTGSYSLRRNMADVNRVHARVLDAVLYDPIQLGITTIGAQEHDLDANIHDIEMNEMHTTTLSGTIITPVQPRVTTLGQFTGTLDLNKHDVVGVGHCQAQTISGPVLDAQQTAITGLCSDAANAQTALTYDTVAAGVVPTTTTPHYQYDLDLGDQDVINVRVVQANAIYCTSASSATRASLTHVSQIQSDVDVGDHAVMNIQELRVTSLRRVSTVMTTTSVGDITVYSWVTSANTTAVPGLDDGLVLDAGSGYGAFWKVSQPHMLAVVFRYCHVPTGTCTHPCVRLYLADIPKSALFAWMVPNWQVNWAHTGEASGRSTPYFMTSVSPWVGMVTLDRPYMALTVVDNSVTEAGFNYEPVGSPVLGSILALELYVL